ncbi:MAG: hypothetical protein M1821_005082 [Bathelium mastoideum]|nr:MAG: hypothetical protein M1821_005082 [Bathelium mastoideum]
MYEPLLETKSSQGPAPQHVVADAKKHLQTLVRLYYLRHGFEAMDLFIVVPLMVAGSDAIDAIHEQTNADDLETLRSTLILVAKGLYDQRRNHYLAEALYRVVRGRMRPRESELLKDAMSPDEQELEEKREMVQAVRSSWPVSVVKKMDDLGSHILTNLVDNYAHLNMEEKPEATED